MPDVPKLCAWCGVEATGRKLTHRPVVRTVKGQKLVVEDAIYASACAKHMAIRLSDEPAVVRARRAATAKKWKDRQERLV